MSLRLTPFIWKLTVSSRLSAVQGNLLHGALADDRADGRGRRLDDGRVGRDRYLLRDVADGELEVLHDRARHLDVERGDYLRLEPLGLNLHAVDARQEGRGLEVAVGVGLRDALRRSGLTADCDPGVGDDRAL